ncbi:Outer membrane protein beta-barrel domain-containing protein [Kaistella chaponensis]|uniref:Outer membrane protein beta-barrel domain-containing protein n=1 Tax=Kaistella chaponensis TaxID=713588 RepID=A0A1N7MM23_9FLAO|nr:porin family protein [Kaistella chaponensis]SIS87214.1 Outer membrane protein beta-barrel domain-containing protein [Kaistella chaponensis]
MKKVLLIGAIALFGALNAQQTKFGLKAGYALSNIVSQELEESLEDEFGGSSNNNSKSGYFIGAFVEHKLNDKFAIQGEAQYANLGGQFEVKYDETAGGLNIKFTLQDKLNFNQILIPISAKYFVIPQLAIYGGPSVAFNAGYKSELKFKDHNIPSEFMGEINQELSALEKEQDDLLKESLKSTAFNIFFGGEYTFYKGLSVDARYTVGLTNYIKDPVDGEELKMNYLQVGLGYKF